MNLKKNNILYKFNLYNILFFYYIHNNLYFLINIFKKFTFLTLLIYEKFKIHNVLDNIYLKNFLNITKKKNKFIYIFKNFILKKKNNINQSILLKNYYLNIKVFNKFLLKKKYIYRKNKSQSLFFINIYRSF